MDASHVAVPSQRLGNQSLLRGVRARPTTLRPREVYLLLYLLHLFLIQPIDHVVDEIVTRTFPIRRKWTQKRRLIDFFLQAFDEIFAQRLTVFTTYFVTSLRIRIARLAEEAE